ncbi:MAG: hypothetical protein IJJ01_03005 [Firmicutes bacterium]|nr:hypothetical protein [Bacillota bacterium]
MNKNKKKTKAAKSIRKAYKQYGEYRAHQYLLLFYSYTEGVRKNDGKDENKGVSEYKTCFNHYVKKEYGQEFFNDYSLFYLANKENKKLLKKLYKYRSEFISRTIVTLNDEPIHNKAEKTKKETKIEEIKEIVTDVQAQILPINTEK